MIEIQLTQGQVTIIDQADAELVMRHKWHAAKDSCGRWRAFASFMDANRRRRRIQLSRFILNDPEGLVVDHIDRNPLNNQRDNLRLATWSQNQCNRRVQRNSSTQLKGVTFRKDIKGDRPFQASIRVHYRRISLGFFATAKEAAEAYDVKAKELHGEFGCPNF